MLSCDRRHFLTGTTEMRDETPAQTARSLMRACERATLATVLGDLGEAWPYASLVLVASDFDAAPLLFISDLAEHTKNLKRSPRASLLFDGSLGLADPLTGSRVTVLGELKPTAAQRALALYGRRPSSAVRS